MVKKYSFKFWVIFWTISGLFLVGWFLFWQVKNQGINTLNSVVNFLPTSEENKGEWKALTTLAGYLLKNDNQEKTFLILFQNNMEIRPGGGYIGSFGILKTKNGNVVSLETHDLSNFDVRIPNTVKPPYPMEETLRLKSWKLRDSNFSPDFETNAKQARYFYELGQGQEKFDGIIGITANVLTSALKITGPIQIEGYPGTYQDENAIIALEYQVEKGFVDQGIPREDRKSIMNDIAKEIIKRTADLNTSKKLELSRVILDDLKKKDIQLYFENAFIQKVIEESGWSGNVDQDWNKDFLMVVDANLGAFKSDYYVKRTVDYSVDMSQETPVANLKITYEHTAKQKDWMTKDYISYLRVYVPDGSWMTQWKDGSNIKFGQEFGKRYFGSIVTVPLGQTKTVEITYTLPKELKNSAYDLKIQKEPGINGVPVDIHVTDNDGQKKDYGYIMNSDWILSESGK